MAPTRHHSQEYTSVSCPRFEVRRAEREKAEAGAAAAEAERQAADMAFHLLAGAATLLRLKAVVLADRLRREVCLYSRLLVQQSCRHSLHGLVACGLADVELLHSAWTTGGHADSCKQLKQCSSLSCPVRSAGTSVAHLYAQHGWTGFGLSNHAAA